MSFAVSTMSSCVSASSLIRNVLEVVAEVMPLSGVHEVAQVEGDGHGCAGYSREGPKTALRILGIDSRERVFAERTLVRDNHSAKRFEDFVDHVHVSKEGH
eukprot:8084380-Heterocapsa_arctica.AAC.1